MKALPFKIPKPENERLIVQVDYTPVFYDRLHHHKEMQISLIKNGTGKLLISDSIHRFEPGDVFVIGENIPHLFQSQKKEGEFAHMITLFFSSESFGRKFFELPELQEISDFFSHSTIGFKLIESNNELLRIMESLPSLSKLERFISLLQLLNIFKSAPLQTLSHYKSPRIHNGFDGKRLQLIFDFVFKNFEQNISLNEISRLIHMTPQAFCRYFKQHTNKTFFEFLIELRIEHACQMITQKPELPIKSVAFLSGFGSISNFNRQFKKLKEVAPKDYLTRIYRNNPQGNHYNNE